MNMRNRRGRIRGGGRGRGSESHSGARPGYPLTMASPDEYVRVVTITTNHAAESRLISMGINPGALLHIISSGGGGPIVVARDETRFGIDWKTAWHVRVVPASREALNTAYSVFCDDNCRGCSYRTEMMRAEYGESVTLDGLNEGETGTVSAIRGRGLTVNRLMKMGFAKGVSVRLLRKEHNSDSLLADVQGKQVQVEGWDALHIILTVNR